MITQSYFPYTIHFPKYWILNDRPEKKKAYSREHTNLLFHVSNNDYFGTLATVLSLMEESIYDKSPSSKIREWELKTLRQSTNDLMYLQENHIIVPKQKK